MTQQDVADVSRDVVRELALQLSLLEAQQQRQQQQPQPGLQQCAVCDRTSAALSGLRAAFDR
jgi:ribosomal protein S14